MRENWRVLLSGGVSVIDFVTVAIRGKVEQFRASVSHRIKMKQVRITLNLEFCYKNTKTWWGKKSAKKCPVFARHPPLFFAGVT